MDTCMPASTPLEQWNSRLQHWDRGTSFFVCTDPLVISLQLPSFHIIYPHLFIHLSTRLHTSGQRIQYQRAFGLPVETEVTPRRREKGETWSISRGAMDYHCQVNWSLSHHLPPTHSTHGHTHARVQDKTLMVVLQQEAWIFHNISGGKKKTIRVYLTQNRHLAGFVFMNAHTILPLQR